jgi:hypothetical protein
MIIKPVMFIYAFRAALRKLWRIVARQPLLIDEIEVERRHGICRKCNKYEADFRQCRVCACFVPLKIQWVDETCPDDPPKW